MNPRQVLLILILLTAFGSAVSAQVNTAFNFQGRLNDGTSPANGRYDLRFQLFEGPTGPDNVGQPFDRFNVLLINGVFSTILDFGPIPFDTGNARYLEIALRPAGSPNAYTVLGGRQPLLNAPYSIRSIYTSFAGLATNATNATNANNAANLGGLRASEYARLNTTNVGTVSATNLAAVSGLAIGGNAIQNNTGFGFVKAMVEVDVSISGIPTIVKCYNGETGAASPATCGITVGTNLLGVYQLNFPFPVSHRFLSAIGRYDSAFVTTSNIGVNYSFASGVNTRVDVFTFISSSPDDTTPADFMLIVY